MIFKFGIIGLHLGHRLNEPRAETAVIGNEEFSAEQIGRRFLFFRRNFAFLAFRFLCGGRFFGFFGFLRPRFFGFFHRYGRFRLFRGRFFRLRGVGPFLFRLFFAFFGFLRRRRCFRLRGFGLFLFRLRALF